MCLDKLVDFEPCDIGYQVKAKTAYGYTAIYCVDVRNPVMSDSKVKTRSSLKLGETYRAPKNIIGYGHARYRAGFHVFNSLDDARRYRQYLLPRRHGNLVILKVNTDGKILTGILTLGRKQCRVTVAEKITLIKEAK